MVEENKQIQADEFEELDADNLENVSGGCGTQSDPICGCCFQPVTKDQEAHRWTGGSVWHKECYELTRKYK